MKKQNSDKNIIKTLLPFATCPSSPFAVSNLSTLTRSLSLAIFSPPSLSTSLSPRLCSPPLSVFRFFLQFQSAISAFKSNYGRDWNSRGQTYIKGVEIPWLPWGETRRKGTWPKVCDRHRCLDGSPNSCIAKDVVEGPPQNLLESVAERISSTTLAKYPQISSVQVKVGKPHVAVHGSLDYLGVEILRHRSTDGPN